MTMSDRGHSDAILPVGARVYTSDGHHLGEVKRISPTRFEVAVSLQPDYWLPRDGVTVVKEGEVWLGYPRSQLGDMKREDPGADEPEDDRNVETIL